MAKVGLAKVGFDRSTCDSPINVFVFIRLLMFYAFELLNSSLSSSSTSILDSSATARLPSICELPLLATAVTAFIARLGLESESGGIGTSSGSCGAANSPAVLPTSSLLLTLSLYFFCDCLAQHLASSTQTLCTFRSCFETFLDSVAGVGVSLCSLSRSDTASPDCLQGV